MNKLILKRWMISYLKEREREIKEHSTHLQLLEGRNLISPSLENTLMSSGDILYLIFSFILLFTLDDAHLHLKNVANTTKYKVICIKYRILRDT